MSSVDFVLEQFNYELEMGVSGELFAGVAPPALTADAEAVYYVSVADMKNAFFFGSDSRDISNADSSDIRYYVDWPAHVVLNPCHAYVDTSAVAVADADGALDDSRLLVKHDFIRHIAKDLFNTHLGVDLFTNEEELKDDLASKGHSDAWNKIRTDISAVNVLSGTLTSDQPDADGLYYTTNALDGSANLCKTILTQLFNTTDGKARLYDLSAIAYNGDLTSNKFHIPFVKGDSIQFKVILKAAPTQHLLVGKATAVPDRSYKVKVKVIENNPSNGSSHGTPTVDAATNVIVDDCVADPTLNDSRVKYA